MKYVECFTPEEIQKLVAAGDYEEAGELMRRQIGFNFILAHKKCCINELPPDNTFSSYLSTDFGLYSKPGYDLFADKLVAQSMLMPDPEYLDNNMKLYYEALVYRDHELRELFSGGPDI